MKRTQMLSKEARKHIIENLEQRGEIEKSELVEMIRPFCVFDFITLSEQKLNLVANNIIRSIRDDSGNRSAFVVRGTDSVIHLNTCTSLLKVASVEEQYAKQIASQTATHQKLLRKRRELEGQTEMFHLLKNG